MRFSLYFVFAYVFAFTLPVYAQFEGTYQVTVRKQEEKKSSRWTLADWLALKQRNHLMDLWLAKNSHSSHFEFYLEARSVNYDKSDGSSEDALQENHNTYGGTFAAYAGVVGLRGTYDGDEENRSGWSGSFNLRILGRALQDTHINLEYGLKGSTFGSTDADIYQNQFGAVSMNLYLARSLGLEGTYQRILPAESNTHRSFEGEDSRAGVFIDFAFIRIFGYWRNELLQFKHGGLSDVTEKRQGYGGGLRLYF